MVTGAEHHELAGLYRPLFGPDGAMAGEDVGERREGVIPRHRDLRAGRKRDVCVGDRRVRHSRAA